MSLIRQIFLAIGLCGFVFANPILANPVQDAFRGKILAGDIAGVEASLTQAAAQDAVPGGDYELQRDLFTVFWATDPTIDTFTADWLAQNPSSTHAMTARGWYLVAMGDANRGGDAGKVTYKGGVQAMLALHDQALTLFTQASMVEPDLLGASDGLLGLTRSVASEATLPLELERIMTLRPNRGSLMRAMYSLAPQWGGNPHQVQAVCDRYAPLVTAPENYTPDICVVDAVYYGLFAPGQMREDASIALQKLTDPVLDFARVLDVLDGKGTAEYRLAVLEKTKAVRPLTPKEAVALDRADNAVKHRDPAVYYVPNFLNALSEGLDALRLNADHNPFYTKAVLDYIEQQDQNLRENGIAYDRDDARARLHRLLTAIPHSWRGWMKLADLSLSDGVERSEIERVAGYLQNSVYYSNTGAEALQHAAGLMMLETDSYAKHKAKTAKPNLTPEDVAEVDSLGRCKVLAFTRMALSGCAELGVGAEQCLVNSYIFLLKPMFEDVDARGVCQAEATAPLESLQPGPVAADF